MFPPHFLPENEEETKNPVNPVNPVQKELKYNRIHSSLSILSPLAFNLCQSALYLFTNQLNQPNKQINSPPIASTNKPRPNPPPAWESSPVWT